ncbi:7734_t:CDS:1, partial [Racocetra persica]
KRNLPPWQVISDNRKKDMILAASYKGISEEGAIEAYMELLELYFE